MVNLNIVIIKLKNILILKLGKIVLIDWYSHTTKKYT